MDGGVRRGFCFPQKGKLRFCGKGEGCRISHIKKKKRRRFVHSLPSFPLLTHSDTGGRLISSHESWGLIHGKWLPKENTHLLGATSIWGQQRDSKIERYSSLTLMWKDRLKDRAVFIWIEPTGFPLRDKRVAITFGACYLSHHSWLFHWHPPLPNELFTDQIFSLLMSGGNSRGCWVAQMGWCSDSESCALQHREPVNFR